MQKREDFAKNSETRQIIERDLQEIQILELSYTDFKRAVMNVFQKLNYKYSGFGQWLYGKNVFLCLPQLKSIVFTKQCAGEFSSYIPKTIECQYHWQNIRIRCFEK